MRSSKIITALVGAGLFGTSVHADLLRNLTIQATEALRAANLTSASGCNLSNAPVRQDWASFSDAQKKSYIRAVQCMFTTPSKSDPSFAPGARNRYDDFVAVHINQTLTIHGTGNFLTWHRYVVRTWEWTLREECGYDGYQPYWNWFTDADDLTKSPIFDGSDTSLSGNGAYFEHNGTLTAVGWVPSGTGGGCVTSGPFVNITLHLGPVDPAMEGLEPNPSPDGVLGYNPRCLSRDLTNYVTSSWFTETNLVNVTTGDASKNISLFQNELQGRFGDGFLGLHTSGHIGVNGEASDLFSSINDPSFYLHHAMVDHLYWIWQALHPEEAATIAGTITILNTPPSRDALLTDEVSLGVNAVNRTIESLLDTLGGTPLCYTYE